MDVLDDCSSAFAQRPCGSISVLSSAKRLPQLLALPFIVRLVIDLCANDDDLCVSVSIYMG